MSKEEVPSQALVERQEQLQLELARYLRLLTTHGSPEKIILFGSLAKGELHRWSDIDLLIVERTSLPFFQRLHQKRLLLQPTVGTDILVYTPEEFEQLSLERPFFREEVLSKGTVLYEQGN
ncbi:MAG: nucleotidyltransferase domain-containing protein [Chloroflexota bacterium]|nr:nucleotidyltransferase domain-containing protein [Chloroflexota bacterium]